MKPTCDCAVPLYKRDAEAAIMLKGFEKKGKIRKGKIRKGKIRKGKIRKGKDTETAKERRNKHKHQI